MAQALYRKYRSKSLAEVVGQNHITTALENALKNGKISHAYLFTGPRGVGKTSVARILAHEINRLPYDEKANHMDIIEIDAASNRRIDEIRELRDKVQNAPSLAKYKVYIIDEVHMLTREAFNALLKTLEEPPAHAVFILATTELHKVPETIISRTQRYNFKPIDSVAVVDHLRHIAKSEGIQATDEALRLIAEHGGGSFRDSISLLDQAGSQSAAVDAESVMRLLGMAPREVVLSLQDVILNGNIPDAVQVLERIKADGCQPVNLAKQLSISMRSLIVSGTQVDHASVLAILHKLMSVQASPDPDLAFEITILDAVVGRNNPPLQIKTKKTSAAVAPTAPDIVITAEPPKITEKTDIIPIKDEPAPTLIATLDETAWAAVLEAVKKRHNTLYGVVRMADPVFENDTLTLCFKFGFHQKRINEARNKQLLVETVSAAFGRPIRIECNLASVDTGKKQPANKSAGVEAISNIFGSAEVLES